MHFKILAQQLSAADKPDFSQTLQSGGRVTDRLPRSPGHDRRAQSFLNQYHRPIVALFLLSTPPPPIAIPEQPAASPTEIRRGQRQSPNRRCRPLQAPHDASGKRLRQRLSPPGTWVCRNRSALFKTAERWSMQEAYRKDCINHPAPKPCVCGRKTFGEALTGAHAGQSLHCEISPVERRRH